MTKRKFFSIKYQKYILPEDKNFWNITRDEVVYRLDENLSRLPRRMRWLAPQNAVACPAKRWLALRSGGLLSYTEVCGIKR
jgi:hypothetical protein